MKYLTGKQNIFLVLGLIILGALSRIFPHPPNVTPLAAIGLLGAAYIGQKYLAVLLPLAVLLISDMFLNNTILRSFFPGEEGFIIWQEYMLFVYLGFISISLIGFYLRRKKTIGSVAGVTIASSLSFFIISNFGVWLQGFTYPKTLFGLWICYVDAIPFFLNSLLGNIFFVVVLFGAYNFLINKLPVAQKNRATI